VLQDVAEDRVGGGRRVTVDRVADAGLERLIDVGIGNGDRAVAHRLRAERVDDHVRNAGKNALVDLGIERIFNGLRGTDADEALDV